MTPASTPGVDEPRCLDILVVAHEYPRPDVAASNRRLVDVLGMIAWRHRVHMHCPIYTKGEVEVRYRSMYRSMGVRVSFGDLDALDRRLRRQRYDMVIFEWWVTAPGALEAVRARQPWARVVVDAVDVCYRREEAAAALGKMEVAEVAANRVAELAVYGGADALMCVTDEDAASLRENGVSAPIDLVPMVEPIRVRPAMARGREVLFVGTFGINPANVDGAVWFAEEAWPAVRARVPGARLTLVGNRPGPEVLALGGLPGVEVTGFVADLEPYLDRAAVSIAPLRFGGGMKGKVTEAMARGLPVVATSFGAQGLGATAGEHLVVADGSEAFARGVVELLEDEARAERIGRAGREFIAGLCSPEVVAKVVDEMLGREASKGRAGRLPVSGRLRATAEGALGGLYRRGRAMAGRRAPRAIRGMWKAVKAGIASVTGRPIG